MNQELKDLILDVREQVLFLKELGVETLDAKLSERLISEPVSRPEPARQTSSQAVETPKAATASQDPAAARPEGRIRLGDLPSLAGRPKSATPTLGWDTPKTPNAGQNMRSEPTVPSGTDETPATLITKSLPEATETIEQIRAEIGKDCTRCKLCTLGRSQVVNSVGNFNAELMFVGEAPGADEDRIGEPFVGRAGQLLTDIIEKGLQIKRSDVFIGNINRCRPPENRAPEPDETAACKPFLLREIAVVRPKVIVVLGATAAHNLLESKVPIGKLRGHFHDYQGSKVMPTFHPAYLLRDPHKKREVWEDMKMVRDFLKSGQ